LGDNGIVRFPTVFASVARLMGKDRSIRAGEYRFHTLMTPREILEMLCMGRVVFHKVTVPEGLTVRQIAALLESRGFVSQEDFLLESRKVDLIRAFGVEEDSLEGYLFPDTYHFAMGVSAGEILKAMVHRFHAVYSPEMRERQAAQGWRLHEVVTLASIIEKETGSEQERGLVSSVLINRLRSGMPLQCDPTVIYGLEEFDGKLRREHLQRPSPYNTYLNKGIPPGPICNPGLSSLQAVLYPEDTPYLYFVSKNDGTHAFSTNLAEHNRAVDKHQKRRGRSTGAPLRQAPWGSLKR